MKNSEFIEKYGFNNIPVRMNSNDKQYNIISGRNIYVKHSSDQLFLKFENEFNVYSYQTIDIDSDINFTPEVPAFEKELVHVPYSTMQKCFEKKDQLIGKNVEFTTDIEDYEIDFDRFQRAKIIDIKDNALNDWMDGCLDIIFSYEETETHNRKFAQSNYYDNTGNPCLNFFETKFYNPNKKILTVYVGPDAAVPFKFVIK